MNTVTIAMKSDESASRIELFVRIVWGIISGIVIVIFAMIAYIFLGIEWLLILILGKRIGALNDWIKKVLIYSIQLSAYIYLVTDERPPIGGGRMNTVTADVKSDEKASRVELFVRIVWGTISYIPLGLFGFVAGICYTIQWLIILITGKRNQSLSNVLQKYISYSFMVSSYLLLLTDERNPIIPAF